MKAMMRTFSLLQENVLPYLSQLLPLLTGKLVQASKNPSKPHFNHFLFETLSLSIRIACGKDPSAVAGFESSLFPVFQDILQQDVQEFVPYIFQLLSLMLECHSSPVPDPYMALFPCLLAPVLWERPGNIHPLVRLLQAFIERGFYIVQSILEHMSPDAVSQYIKQIFLLLFQRLQSSKTTKFVRGLLVFFSLYVYRYGAPALISTVDSIQTKMFGMVLERLVIAGYDSVPDDEHFVEIEDTPGYQTAYSQLIFAGKKEHDPFQGNIPDARLHLVRSLQKLSAACPGRLGPLISSSLQPAANNFLQRYFQMANVQLM
ncbi:hypothetical protein MRX96_006601 [Rhipicephalus microplus]